MAGRKTKLTDAVWNIIITAIENGHHNETACELAGVSVFTFYEWIQRGEDRHKTRSFVPRYAKFAQAVKKARAVSEDKMLAQITKASDKHWTAAAWFLERKFPDRWREIKQLDIGVPKDILDKVARLTEALEALGLSPGDTYEKMIQEAQQRAKELERADS